MTKTLIWRYCVFLICDFHTICTGFNFRGTKASSYPPPSYIQIFVDVDMTLVKDTFWDTHTSFFFFLRLYPKAMLHFAKQSPKNSSPWSGNILRRCSFHLLPRPICLHTGGKWIFSFVKVENMKIQPQIRVAYGDNISKLHRRCSPLWRGLINSGGGSGLLRSNCGPSHSFL